MLLYLIKYLVEHSALIRILLVVFGVNALNYRLEAGVADGLVVGVKRELHILFYHRLDFG